MLSPRAPSSSAFVCLRCSLKLARHVTSISRRPLHATFSTSTSRYDDPDSHDGAANTETTDSHARLSARPLRNFRRRRSGPPILQSTAHLEGVKTLGEDADILVLKQLRRRRRENRQSETDIQPLSEAQNASNILAQLEAEAAQVGEEEVNQQIEKLRPKTYSTSDEPHFITQAAYKKIAKGLAQGFTVPQLSRYFSVANGIKQSGQDEKLNDGPQAELKAKMGTGKRPVDRTQWYPGTTAFAKRRVEASFLKGQKSKPPSKSALVDQILRNVWNFVLLEEIEGDGELELALKPWQISLLNVGETPTPLDKIGSMRKAKIEIIADSVLRITADKSSAEYAADDVEQLLKKTELQTFNIDPWLDYIQEDRVPKDKPTRMFSPATLHEVERLSGTIIQIVSDSQVMIRGVDKDSLQEAQRCLVRSLPLKRAGTHSIETQRLDDSKDECHLVPNTFNSSLAYPSRHLQLGRWTAPVPKLPAIESSPDASTTDSNPVTDGTPTTVDTGALKKKILDTLLARPQYEPPESGKSIELSSEARWHVHPNRRMAVYFGQALFPVSEGGGASTSSSQPPKSVFSTDIPGLANVMTAQSFRTAHGLGNLDYRFTPSPLQRNPLNSTDYPELRIRFQAHGEVKLKGVSLKFGEHHHDVLLPDQATDMRFSDSYNLSLRSPLLDPNIKEFSDSVVANIKSGGRLTAPPEISIEVPRWVLPGYTRNNPNTRTITYLFAGIAHQQTLLSPYHEHLSALNVIQQGTLGSKGGAFSLKHMSHAKGSTEESAGSSLGWNDLERSGNFVDLAFELAESITKASASQVPLAKVWRPRAEMSARKQRRSATSSEITLSQPPNTASEEETPPSVTEDYTSPEDATDSEKRDTLAPSISP